MKKLITVLMLTMTIGASQVLAGDHDPKVIIPLLKDAKITLLDGIDYAEKSSGPATSAKFEVSDGKLILSVYTIPEGLGVEPETATLTEMGAVATESPIKPVFEVFADKEHIARASVHMTLFQLSKLNLKQVIQRALKVKAGAPIDVRNPMVRDSRPVADVVIADYDGDAYTVTVDLLSGRAKLKQ
jgi:hypothetical protein